MTSHQETLELFAKNMNDFYSSFSSQLFLDFYLNANSLQLFQYNHICDCANQFLFNFDGNPISYEQMKEFNEVVGDFFDGIYMSSYAQETDELIEKVKKLSIQK